MKKSAKTVRTVLVAFTALAAFFAAAIFTSGPVILEIFLSPVRDSGPYKVSARAAALHEKLFVADLHADAMMLGRDLLSRSPRGHVDVPRMIEGNEALQVFAAVTGSPLITGIDNTSDTGPDAMKILAVIARWPRATWTSRTQRALFLAGRLRDMADDSGGRLTVIETADDLRRFMSERAKDRNRAAALLAVEGAHALDGRAENVETLFRAGYRMIAPTHFFDNEIAGSAQGVAKGGLTPLGKRVFLEASRMGMVIDLAHSSDKTISDVLTLVDGPVVVSHTGVRGTCDNNRNVTDEQIRRIASTGGVIGVGYWEMMLCGADAAAIARAVRHIAKVAGVDHAALGSDFDGSIEPPFDVSGLPLITEALLAEGFTEEEIAKIMGGNAARVLLEALPGK